MTALYEAYETNKDSEKNGVWIDEVGGARFQVSRMGGANSRYQKALTAAMKPFMREIQLGMVDNDTLEPIMRKVFIDTILIGWEKVQDRLGETLDFTKSNAETLFTDLPDLYARLRDAASNYTNFRAVNLKVAAGN